MPRFLNQPASEAPPQPQDWRSLRRLLPFLWPTGDRALKARLVISIGLLVLTALLNALVPILFARAVDRLGAPPTAVLTAPVLLLLSYGLLQWLAKVFNELRWAL